MNGFAGVNVKEIDKKLFKKNIFDKINDITIDGVKYKFKPLEKNEYGIWTLDYYYNSLIIKKLADMVNIDCCEVSLGVLKKKPIILMPNYEKEGFDYISGEKILYDYLGYLEENKIIKETLGFDVKYPLSYDEKKELTFSMNNLQVIIDALKYRYRNDSIDIRDNKVSKIVIELFKRYGFDYLTLQNDRHKNNWAIEENKETAQMVQLFDNGISLQYEDFAPEMKVNLINGDFPTEIEKFLTYSSNEIKNKFIEMYNTLSVETFISVVESIGDNISPIYKENIISSYSKNYEDITKVLKKLNLIDGGLKQ